MYSHNQIFKFSYHFLACLLILYIATKKHILPDIVRVLLLIIAISHAYDSWWFLNYDANAPI